MNERMIKRVDSLFSAPAVRIASFFYRRKRPLPAFEDCRSFLIIRPGGIGDLALLLPQLRLLTKHQRSVCMLCNRRNLPMAELLKKHGLLQDVGLLENISDVGSFRGRRFDVVLDTEQSFYSSALIARLVSPKAVIGFDTNERRGLYDDFVRYHQEEYEAQSFLNLLKPFKIETALDLRDLHFPPIPLLSPPTDLEQTLVVFVGAPAPIRRIPLGTLREVLSETAPNFSSILAIGGKQEHQGAEELLRGIPGTINLCGKTNLEGTLAILQRAKAFLGADAGPLHLAVLANVPKIVAIFGPGIEKKWGHPEIMRVITADDLYCRPCNYSRFSQTPPCPFGADCMGKVTPEQIISALTG